jgi:hypothetical protein
MWAMSSRRVTAISLLQFNGDSAIRRLQISTIWPIGEQET